MKLSERLHKAEGDEVDQKLAQLLQRDQIMAKIYVRVKQRFN
jgi:hypothetical protein